MPVVFSSLIASALGAIITGQQNKQQAKKAMQFSAQQSATAHQREVADLRAAGLNPMLSGTGGQGASSMPGIPASIPDALGAGLSSAQSVARTRKELEIAEEQKQLIKTQATNVAYDTALKQSQTGQSDSLAAKTRTEKELLDLAIPGAKNTAESEKDLGPTHKAIRTILETIGKGTNAVPNLRGK